MTQEEIIRKMILAWPVEKKLEVLKELNDNQDFGKFTQILNVLLEAPLSEGGVSSDLIQKYLEMN